MQQNNVEYVSVIVIVLSWPLTDLREQGYYKSGFA